MPSPATIFVGCIIILVCVGTLGMIVLKAMTWAQNRRTDVNGYQDAPSSSYPVRTSSLPGSQRVEPPKIAETHQVKPIEPPQNDPPHDPLIISHKMSKKELTILLAAQKNDTGAYRFSANEIAKFIGGTSAEVKGWVAEVRGKREPAANSLRRPANGW